MASRNASHAELASSGVSPRSHLVPTEPFDDMIDTPEDRGNFKRLPFHVFDDIYARYKEADRSALDHQTLHALLTGSAVWGGAAAVIAAILEPYHRNDLRSVIPEFVLSQLPIPISMWVTFLFTCTVALLFIFFWNLRKRIRTVSGPVWIVAGLLLLSPGIAYFMVKVRVNRLLAFEIWAVLVSASCFFFGWITKQKENWLVFRHQAEFYRHLKFKLLIHHENWRDHEWLGNEIKAENGPGNNDAGDVDRLGAYLRRAVSRLPHGQFESTSQPQGVVLKHVVGYYRSKRLQQQIGYLDNRTKRNESRNSVWSWAVYLFPASVIAATIHAILEAYGREEYLAAATLFLVAAAVLPVFSAGIRAWRGAYEFARNSTRFLAAGSALDDLRKTLQRQEELLQDDDSTHSGDREERSTRVLGIIHECERILSTEHIEWLRLMVEAEWTF